MFSINKVNELSKSEFISIFGNIFEKTEWIANKVFELKPFKDNDDFFSKITNVFKNSGKKKILEIINSHPDLAVKGKLTEDSRKEQNSANLNECTEEELIEFNRLNKEYKIKFKFPFIIAVKEKTRKEILTTFKKRIHNSINKEFNEAKIQVNKIAIIRLNQIFYNN